MSIAQNNDKTERFKIRVCACAYVCLQYSANGY